MHNSQITKNQNLLPPLPLSATYAQTIDTKWLSNFEIRQFVGDNDQFNGFFMDGTFSDNYDLWLHSDAINDQRNWKMVWTMKIHIAFFIFSFFRSVCSLLSLKIVKP